MGLKRKDIRYAVKDLLVGANTAASDRVFPNRLRELDASELPAILIYTRNEPAKSALEPTPAAERELRIVIELIATGSTTGEGDSVDDVLDDMAEQVEKAIENDWLIGNRIFRNEFVGTETGLSDEGEVPMASLALTYNMQYHTALPGME